MENGFKRLCFYGTVFSSYEILRHEGTLFKCQIDVTMSSTRAAE